MTLTATIFYFIQDDKDNAYNALVIGIYLTVTIYLLLRILFYFRYKATLNEIFFVLIANIFPVILIFIEKYVPISSDHYFNISILLEQNNVINLYVTLISFLTIPYFVLATVLQVRSFTRYEFFRWTPTSEKGFKAEWIAIVVYFVFGPIFIFVAFVGNDLFSLFFGIIYLFSGLEFLLAK